MVHGLQQSILQEKMKNVTNMFTFFTTDEERPACRPLRTFPCYEKLKNYGAQFGQVNGWERPITLHKRF